jgi:copper(I)-binding protein
MTARAVRWWAALALAMLPMAACTYFPTVRDTGGVRLQPEEGRLVRQETANAAVFHMVLKSTGKFGDTLFGAEAPIARRAQLLASDGAAVPQIEIPGETVVTFGETGPRVVLSDLTRSLTPGEVVIVTLYFKKYGALGIISVVQ